MINTSKVKGRLAELSLTQKDVATALGIAQPTANQKINNNRPMDLDEAEKLANLLRLTPEEFQPYFFARELHSATKEGRRNQENGRHKNRKSGNGD